MKVKMSYENGIYDLVFKIFLSSRNQIKIKRYGTYNGQVICSTTVETWKQKIEQEYDADRTYPWMEDGSGRNPNYR